MNGINQTSIGLTPQQSQQLVPALNRCLATAIDLQLQIKQAHWNVKGPQFIARHELFDKLAGHLRELSDQLAERVSTLGGYAEGTVRLCAENSVLAEYDLKAVRGESHIRALVDAMGRFCSMLRSAIDGASDAKDPVTVGIYTDALQQAELDVWFLESHLSPQPVDATQAAALQAV